MNLTDMMKEIRKLVKEKGHEDTLDDVQEKLLFAIIEISEAADLIKKHWWSNYTDKEGKIHITILEIEEELIDAIFYILDSYGIIHRDLSPSWDPDQMFEYKLEKNFNREYRYGRPDK